MKLIARKDEDANSGPFADSRTSMESAKRIGLTLFALVFGFFGLWAGLAPLDGAAFAPGTVKVKSYKKAVQHLEGGIVSDILVENGDLVESAAAAQTRRNPAARLAGNRQQRVHCAKLRKRD